MHGIFKKKGIKSFPAQFVLVTIISLIVIWSLLPVIITLLGSVKTNYELQQSVWAFPKTPQWRAWSYGITGVLRNMGNTLIVCFVAVFGVVFLGALSAYVFVRHEFPFKNVLFSLIIALMVVPSIISLLPQYLLIVRLNLTNNWLALILPYVSGGQVGAIFLFRTFMSQQPKDLYEAAKIDGAKEFTMFLQICMPLTVPVIAIQSVSLFSSYYNDFLWPMLVLDDKNIMTLMPVLQTLIEDVSLKSGLYATSNVIYLLSGVPLVFVTAFSLKYMINGDFASGLKL